MNEAEYKAHRRHQYELYRHYLFPEEDIIPPWDLVGDDDREYFYEERKRLLYRYHVLGERPSFEPGLYPVEQDQALAEWKKTWFICDEPYPLFGKSVDAQIEEIAGGYCRRLAAERAAREKLAGKPPRRRGGRRRADADIEQPDDGRHTRDDYTTSEDYYRYKIASGLVASADYEPTIAGGPQAVQHLAFHPMPKPRRATTTFINTKQFGNCYSAVAFANSRSSIMNTHVSITWSTVGLDLDPVVGKRRAEVCERICKFIVETLDTPFDMIWVNERGSTHGLHTHMLLHVPPRYKAKFEAVVNKAVETVTGKKPMKTAESSTVYVRQVKTVAEQWQLFAYLMKGVYRDEKLLNWRQRDEYEAFVTALKLPARSQGQVTGQRVGTSRRLVRKRRADAGFVSLWDQGIRDPHQLFSHHTFMSEDARRLERSLRNDLDDDEQ